MMINGCGSNKRKYETERKYNKISFKFLPILYGWCTQTTVLDVFNTIKLY